MRLLMSLPSDSWDRSEIQPSTSCPYAAYQYALIASDPSQRHAYIRERHPLLVRQEQNATSDIQTLELHGVQRLKQLQCAFAVDDNKREEWGVDDLGARGDCLSTYRANGAGNRPLL
jgi:hypothetical protein